MVVLFLRRLTCMSAVAYAYAYATAGTRRLGANRDACDHPTPDRVNMFHGTWL
jgi:hypothetical protein